jgi:arylsulfatase A-like enzyme
MAWLTRRTLGYVMSSAFALAAGLLWPVEIEVSAGDGDRPEPPKLAVLIVFDQMRGDYLPKWDALFGEGGFKRLQKEGASFSECHYPYAFTFTAPGHASLVTGCSPRRHGIIANDWFDPALGKLATSVTPPAKDAATREGPYRRKEESIGEVLRRATLGKGRVVSLSIKDRAAILLAALRDCLCFWLNANTGDFVTSPYYQAKPRGDWVEAFNADRKAHAQKWLGGEWRRFKEDPELYRKVAGEDDVPFEGVGYQQGRTFPHPFPVVPTKKDPTGMRNYYDAVSASPAGNELLLALATVAIEKEQLGKGEATDLLCLSFSSNDLVGHTWGPDSQEVFDITLRSDALVKELLDFLDARVGKGRYVVAVTADHGVSPIPEVARQQGKDAGRVEPVTFVGDAAKYLNTEFGQQLPAPSWLDGIDDEKKIETWFYLKRETLTELKLDRAVVEKKLAGWLATQGGIQVVFTRTELEAKDPPADALAEKVWRSFDPERGPDVWAVLKPYYMLSRKIVSDKVNPTYRTTHGTPHPCDTHVPLLVMGPRIGPGVRDEPITPLAMANILAEAMGIPRPKGATAPVPAGLFKE